MEKWFWNFSLTKFGKTQWLWKSHISLLLLWFNETAVIRCWHLWQMQSNPLLRVLSASVTKSYSLDCLRWIDLVVTWILEGMGLYHQHIVILTCPAVRDPRVNPFVLSSPTLNRTNRGLSRGGVSRLNWLIVLLLQLKTFIGVHSLLKWLSMITEQCDRGFFCGSSFKIENELLPRETWLPAEIFFAISINCSFCDECCRLSFS